jgi:hypothetical protein
MLSPTSRAGKKEHAADLAYSGAQGRPLSRRAFLVTGGAVATVAAVMVAGHKAMAGGSAVEAQENSSQQTAAHEDQSVACPLGLINDPYPGRCKHYRDSDGDGICDYSVAGSGSSLTGSGRSAFGGELPRQRSGFARR